MDFTIRVGGEAGQGMLTIGSILVKFFSRSGFHVFSHQDYMSRIRGGHNFYQIRIADRPVTASVDQVDILVALDENTVTLHHNSLTDTGLVICDNVTVQEFFAGDEFVKIPFVEITEQRGLHRIMANTAVIGAVLGVFDLDISILPEIIKSHISPKDAEVIESNMTAAHAGFAYMREHCAFLDNFKLDPPRSQKLLLINGNQAIGLGALLGGCKFYAAYPMTPSTSIMAYISSKAEQHGVLVEQAEDEIAAVNMILGASYAGVRAMTGTSGGGFALMTEGLSLAGITETPIVIAEVQRPGPATGRAPRTEQSDLFFALHGGHGEFPRVLLTPGTPEQAVYLTCKAFDLAEKYQIPVIIQSDQYLADSQWTYTGFNEEFPYEDYRLRQDRLQELESYRRYADSEDGISPLAVPGASKHLVVVDSDEHDEEGHIIEDAQTRIKMVQKRLFKKLPSITKEIAPPSFHGHRQPQIVLVGYGSTYGVMREAVDHLGKTLEIGMLHFSELYPFPLIEPFDYLALLRQATHTICVENNASGQFARLVRAETGIEFSSSINKYDGRPFSVNNLLEEINGILQ